MITIKRDSWHWKYIHSFIGADANYIRSLCEYVQKFVLVTFFYTLMACVGLLVFFAAITPLWLLSDQYSFTDHPIYLGGALLDLVIFGALIKGWLEPKYWEYREKKGYNQYNTVRKEPSLLLQWVRAKKAKVCPLVEIK